jgi:hypothetical protein
MQRVQMMIRALQETSPHEQILFPKVKQPHPVIILFVLLAALPSQQDAIQALPKALTQVTKISVKVTCNLEQKNLLTNTYQAFQAVLLIPEEKKTIRLSTIVELFL